MVYLLKIVIFHGYGYVINPDDICSYISATFKPHQGCRPTSLVRSLRGKQLSEALSTFQRFTASGGRVTRHIFSTLLKLGQHHFSLVRVVLFLHFGVYSHDIHYFQANPDLARQGQRNLVGGNPAVLTFESSSVPNAQRERERVPNWRGFADGGGERKREREKELVENSTASMCLFLFFQRLIIG